MLIRFSIENWMSFQAKATFSLIVSRERQYRERIPKIGKLKLGVLPVAAVYGGNASGKTNLFKPFPHIWKSFKWRDACVITKEPERAVKERLKYNFQAVGTKASIVCSQKLVLGRTLILDFDRFTYQEILTGEYIKKHFKTVSGDPIF